MNYKGLRINIRLLIAQILDFIVTPVRALVALSLPAGWILANGKPKDLNGISNVAFGVNATSVGGDMDAPAIAIGPNAHAERGQVCVVTPAKTFTINYATGMVTSVYRNVEKKDE